jgi:hypothetical protein
MFRLVKRFGPAAGVHPMNEAVLYFYPGLA